MRIAAIATAALALAACNDVPVAGTLDSMSAVHTVAEPATGRVKLDILWVIDNSGSMCQEQNALAANVDAFLGTIGSLIDVDPRLAVVTTDALTESERGRFHHEAATSFPPGCAAAVVEKCLTDDDCANALAGKVKDPSLWRCKPPSQGASGLTNPNGSLNSMCRLICQTDADCAVELDGQHKCTPFDAKLHVCLAPPDVAGCPAVLPDFVDEEVAASMGSTVSEVFRCMAIVGALSTQSAQFEQGLRTATLALDVNGPNAAQAKGFLRPDAYQVVIFLSDEEDCSTSDHMPASFVKDGSLQLEARQLCGLLGDTDGKGPLGEDLAQSPYPPSNWRDPSGRGPLEPVGTFVNALRAINSDPSRVLVAGIVGDVVMSPDGNPAKGDPTGALVCPTTAGQDLEMCYAERVDAYLRSKGAPGPSAKSSYVCQSAVGQADWGGRYLKLVSAFGRNGVATNICNAGGFSAALEQIAETILRRVVRICLDEQIEAGGALVVTKVLGDGTAVALTQGEDADFVVMAADDCGTGEAIFFNDLVKQTERIEVSYPAALFPTVSP